MILGFAHLTENTGDIANAEKLWLSQGYQRSAWHKGVPNHASKAAFTSQYEPTHDLMLLSGEGLWPLELTFHGNVDGNNKQIFWSKDHITLSVPDVRTVSDILQKALGFSIAVEGIYSFTSRFPNWNCRIRLEQSNAKPVTLDASGATALAFYTNRIIDDAEMIVSFGATHFSGIFELQVGDRDMLIALARLPGGPLIELIEPKRKKS